MGIVALAQDGVEIGEEFGSPFDNFGQLVSVILSNAYILAGVVLLFLLIFGGFSIIMGAGGGNPEQAARGKQAVTWAIIGAVVVFTSYWIIQLIEVITGVGILNPQF